MVISQWLIVRGQQPTETKIETGNSKLDASFDFRPSTAERRRRAKNALTLKTPPKRRYEEAPKCPAPAFVCGRVPSLPPPIPVLRFRTFRRPCARPAL